MQKESNHEYLGIFKVTKNGPYEEKFTFEKSPTLEETVYFAGYYNCACSCIVVNVLSFPGFEP